MSDRFVYVTYIRTTAEKLWEALTNPDFTRRYWFGISSESEWRVGAPWKLVFADGRIADAGEVVEIERPRRIVLAWRNNSGRKSRPKASRARPSSSSPRAIP